MANSLSFTMNLGAVKEIAKAMEATGPGWEASLLGALTKSAIEVQGIARLQAPSRTGRLRNSINFRVLGLTAIIKPNVKYAGYVEMGTGIYGYKGQAITPTSKKVLATKVNPGFGSKNKAGYFIIGKSSKGQKPNPFMERTVTLARPIVLKNFKTAVKNEVKKFERAKVA